MDVAFYLFDASCDFDLQLLVLVFEFDDLDLQLGYFVSVLELLVIQILNCLDLVQLFFHRLLLLLQVLVRWVQ